MTQDDARRRILARRARFVAIAVAGFGIPAGTQACGGEVDSNKAPVAKEAGAEACLSYPDAADDQAQPCLGAPNDASDDGPQPCLDPPMDAGPDACLAPPPEDAGDAPTVCLDIDPDAGADA